jgi:glucosamine 6-phosphate synthetase-like amidotransferase/phosphosugar isomerase protein
MCGVAGYSVDAASGLNRTLAAQALLAGIAERGSDAVGYAVRTPDGPLEIVKRRAAASALLDDISLPEVAAQVLLHVRDYTKGHPSIAANNHPIRHGAVVGVHNGIILNDEELIVEHGIVRAQPDMSVDSEVIFALAESSRSDPRALEQLRGSMAAAWLDERDPHAFYLARGVGRPLWIGEGRHELAFASTKAALEVMERYTKTRLRKHEVAEGTLLRVEAGRVVKSQRFKPSRSYEESSLPAVRAPQEGVHCLKRLAVLASLTA